MKYLAQFGTILMVLFLFSCQKDISSIGNNSTLSGKWNILSDSSYVGVGAGNHVVNYVGRKGDYFDFNENGKLYVDESGKSEILNYAITSDSTISIDSFLDGTNGVSEKCYIIDFTSNNVIISSPISYTPGGTFGRKVHLTR